ncbi:hypothetical protein [Agrococcus sp. SGAir0287]|uniref:hypothetical protein n=1 Tax=Agrococcus sp. SGAir0287 TaxID=2070347 RepID=UPI0010CD617B|nr:hypothetical protein [Agrococcus sp. SGAir0287]QCR18461.1 hypothetical protein C1N71_02510 [Agrococcus sp. SGAir0287]
MDIPAGAIVREWSALVETARVDEYLTFMRDTTYDRYVAIDGNLGTHIHSRDLGDGRTEVRVLSHWRDEAAIRAFAGYDIQRPISYPDDDEFLLEHPQPVRHWTLR